MPFISVKTTALERQGDLLNVFHAIHPFKFTVTGKKWQGERFCNGITDTIDE